MINGFIEIGVAIGLWTALWEVGKLFIEKRLNKKKEDVELEAGEITNLDGQFEFLVKINDKQSVKIDELIVKLEKAEAGYEEMRQKFNDLNLRYKENTTKLEGAVRRCGELELHNKNLKEELESKNSELINLHRTIDAMMGRSSDI